MNFLSQNNLPYAQNTAKIQSVRSCHGKHFYQSYFSKTDSNYSLYTLLSITVNDGQQ